MADELILRLARPAERGELESLQRRASLMWDEDRAALLAGTITIELPSEQIDAGRVFVAELHGRLAGFCVVLRRDDLQGELDGLFVEPDVWRTGIGSRLLKEAERIAMHDGAEVLHVIANRRALRFYLACGFKLIGEIQTRLGPAPTMCKRLT
jgi:GNAT superfamily N-acetyltransferase